MATKRIQRKIYTITQQMDSKNFNGTWNDTTTIDSYINDFIERFETSRPQKVVHFAIIVHDKDTRTVGGTKENKPTHFHCYLEFDKPVDLSMVARFAGVEEQYIEVLKRGKYAKENTLAYLIHAKQPGKHQYKSTEVYSDGAEELTGTYGWTNGWYHDFYAEHAEDWANQLATGKQHNRNLSLDKILDMIVDGKITMQNILLTDDLRKLYARNMNKFKDAFQASAEFQSIRISALISSGDINVEAYYVWGESGIGKTYMLKQLMKDISEDVNENKWFTASANHPFDNYSGEPYILLDDVGAKALSVKDWLHLLDPHNNYEFGASRYHNKPIAAHTIVITSTKSPEDYFNQLLEIANGSEPIEQVFRRLWSIIHVINNGNKIVAEIEKHPKDDAINFQKKLTVGIDDARKMLGNHFVEKQKKINQKIENQQSEDDKN